MITETNFKDYAVYQESPKTETFIGLFEADSKYISDRYFDGKIELLDSYNYYQNLTNDYKGKDSGLYQLNYFFAVRTNDDLIFFEAFSKMRSSPCYDKKVSLLQERFQRMNKSSEVNSSEQFAKFLIENDDAINNTRIKTSHNALSILFRDFDQKCSDSFLRLLLEAGCICNNPISMEQQDRVNRVMYPTVSKAKAIYDFYKYACETLPRELTNQICAELVNNLKIPIEVVRRCLDVNFRELQPKPQWNPCTIS